MKIKKVIYYETKIGKIGIVEDGAAITNLCFESDPCPPDALLEETELLKKAGLELQSYLSGKLQRFTLPLAPAGTDFMQKVWRYLQEIPYGETRSYQQVAQSIGNSKAVRAVGQANNRNPLPILIPCHRVIGANGKLVGYGGGLPIKSLLLELEQRHQ